MTSRRDFQEHDPNWSDPTYYASREQHEQMLKELGAVKPLGKRLLTGYDLFVSKVRNATDLHEHAVVLRHEVVNHPTFILNARLDGVNYFTTSEIFRGLRVSDRVTIKVAEDPTLDFHDYLVRPGCRD